MPVLSRMVKEGAVAWSATDVTLPLRLPLASLLTGLPVETHGIIWDSFDLIRGYPRPPTVFDYLDLSGGGTASPSSMDESLYQLAKPEPYTHDQMRGPLEPEYRTHPVVGTSTTTFARSRAGMRSRPCRISWWSICRSGAGLAGARVDLEGLLRGAPGGGCGDGGSVGHL